MRWICSVCLLLAQIGLWSQANRTWIGDKSKVGCNVSENDTTFYIHGKQNKIGEWTIYYDSTFSIRAVHVYYNENNFRTIDTMWYRSGQIKEWYHDKDYIIHGCYEYQSWFPDGKLHKTTYCDGDTTVYMKYYHSGKIEAIDKNYKDSTLNWMVLHYQVEYYENGQKKSDPNDINGSRKNHRSYYENGQPSREVIWKGDSTLGDCKEWYSNGKLKAKGQYELPLFLRNVYPVNKIGTWSYYNESGKLIKEEFYEEGKLVKTIEY